ncbi:hypothetical protein V8F20_010920 [Naviculisporaceae sp. PSN 640]
MPPKPAIRIPDDEADDDVNPSAARRDPPPVTPNYPPPTPRTPGAPRAGDSITPLSDTPTEPMSPSPRSSRMERGVSSAHHRVLRAIAQERYDSPGRSGTPTNTPIKFSSLPSSVPAGSVCGTNRQPTPDPQGTEDPPIKEEPLSPSPLRFPTPPEQPARPVTYNSPRSPERNPIDLGTPTPPRRPKKRKSEGLDDIPRINNILTPTRPSNTPKNTPPSGAPMKDRDQDMEE